VKHYLILLCLAFSGTGYCQNISVIGNNGEPQTTTGHIPLYIPGLALDAAGNIYSVHDWDEPHYDIIRRNPSNGYDAWHSGHVAGYALWDAIAVEADGSAAYCAGYIGNPADPNRQNLEFSVWKATLTGSSQLIPFSSWVNPTTDPNGHIMVYPNGTYTYPSGSSSADQAIMEVPLHALAVSGSNLYVTDSYGGKVLAYDKTSGVQQLSINVSLAIGLAIDSSGNIWVGSAHSTVQVYSSAGVLLGTPITGLSDVYSLAITGSTLYVADRGASHIGQYTISGTSASYVKTIGVPETPGYSSGNSIGALWAIASNPSGETVFSHSPGNGEGSRMLLMGTWNRMCTEFQGNATHSAANPNLLIGSYRNTYNATRGSTNVGRWSGCARTDYGAYFGNIQNSRFGTMRALTLGGNDFVYFPCEGGNMCVYRVVAQGAGYGPALQMASVLAQSAPAANGQLYTTASPPQNLWSWNDVDGPGLTSVNAQTVLGGSGLTLDEVPKSPYWQWAISGMNVDDNGTIWVSTLYRQIQVNGTYQLEYQSLWAVPLHGLNTQGNPIYHWADAVEVVTNTQLCDALGITPGNNKIDIQVANLNLTDGQLYVMVYNPAGASRGGSWTSGNAVIAFAETGTAPVGSPLWTKTFTPYVNSLAPVPTGGFIVGQNVGVYNGGVIQRFDKNGNSLATYAPSSNFGSGGTSGNNPCGAFDVYGAIDCELSGQAIGGALDIFWEDDFNGRVFWLQTN